MKKDLKNLITEKAQGLIEYVLILAFIAGIGLMFASGGLKGTLAGTVTETNSILAGLFSGKTYSDYFHEWRKTPLNELGQIDEKERLNADQQALAILARVFMDMTASEVNKKMQELTNGGNLYGYNLGNNYKEGVGGYSGQLIPLSYQSNNLDGESGFIWLDANKNQNTVKLLESDAVVYDKTATANPYSSQYDFNGKKEARTTATDRLFYSNDMISDSGQRTIAMQVHYNPETHKVDSVKIAAYVGRADGTGTVASGLNLNVTKTEIQEIQD